MKVLNAKEYAAQRNYPLATIRRLCREKIIPNFTVGRVYKIDVQQADEYFSKKMMNASSNINTQIVKRNKNNSKSYLERLKDLQKEILK